MMHFTPRRLTLILLLAVLALGLAVAAGLGLWALRLLSVNEASLTGVARPEISSYDCLVAGQFVRPGPAMRVNTDWVIDEDLVPVLSEFQRAGWQASTHMTTNIQLLPNAPTALDLGLLRVRVFRALSLSYTRAGTTRVAASTRFVVCPP